MTYTETVDYLYTRLPMFSRIGAKGMKLDLAKTRSLMERLGNPEQKITTIHIAGTNGKGSVSHMLAAILQTAGFRTGLYTSPHLRDFRERIKIDGCMVPHEFVVGFVSRQREFIEQLQPSFFELTFAMAMDYFATEKVDVAVIETGLGGRLDSTNVITPILSVITNIGYDHMDILGDTLEKIATEKAGIIKRGVPVVIGESDDVTEPVFVSMAAERGAPIDFADQSYKVVDAKPEGELLCLQIENQATGVIESIETDLAAVYQKANLLTAFAAAKSVAGRLGVKEHDIRQGLKTVQRTTGFEGRWQILRKKPYVIMDVAHNPAGMTQLLRQLAQMRFRKLHVIIGMVKDKDTSSMLRLLPVDAIYYFTNAHIPRALPADELLVLAREYQLAGVSFDDGNDALTAALAAAAPDDLILICGSVFVVGEIDKKKFAGADYSFPSSFNA